MFVEIGTLGWNWDAEITIKIIQQQQKKEVGIRNRSKKRNLKNPTKQEIEQNKIK